MRRQPLITCKLPSTIRQEMDGKQHFYEALYGSQVVVGLIEETMSQTGTYEDTNEAIEEQGVEELVLDLLLLIQALDHQIGQCQSD